MITIMISMITVMITKIIMMITIMITKIIMMITVMITVIAIMITMINVVITMMIKNYYHDNCQIYYDYHGDYHDYRDYHHNYHVMITISTVFPRIVSHVTLIETKRKCFFGTNENIVPKRHFLLVSFRETCHTMRGNTVITVIIIMMITMIIL